MNPSIPFAVGPRQLQRATWLLLALWTLVVAASAVWNVRLLREAMLDAATQDARNSYDQDVLYLLNPAYMTRQVHELGQRYGARGHITSLKPLRPENAPDAWETAALRAFEQGQAEVLSPEPLNGQPHLRFMRPLVVEAGCLKCHTAQEGYREGKIRGGISLAVPLAPYDALAQAQIGPIAGAHAGLWALGALGLFLASRQMRQRLDQQARAELEIQHQAAFARFNPNPVLELSAGGEITYFNLAAGEMARSLGQEHPAQLLPPNIPSLVRECLATGESKLRVEIRFGLRVISWSFFPVTPNHTVHGYAGDITERKQAEEALRDSEALYHSLVGHLPQCVLRKDVNGRFTFANQNFCRLLGRTPAEIQGLTDFDCFPRELAEKYRQDDQRVMQDGRMWEQVEENLLPNGERIFVHVVKTPLINAAGEVVGVQGIFWDITERKQAEDKLRQLSRAVDQSPASIVITDPVGRIEYVNPKFIAVTGYSLAEALGKNPRILKSGDKPPEAYRELWQTITAGQEWRGEFRNKKKNGELYWESASISPIRDGAGNITHFLAVKEDITARKQTEVERERLIAELQNTLAEIKTLQGIIPICAGCKKIRDDQGYWSQVETYVAKHSRAKFSHGMCPDCVKKWEESG